jgi:uncharacterized protein (TIRG00374 family)
VGKYGRILGGILLTVFFLWLALRNVDIHAVRDALRHASYGFLVPAALCGALGYCLRTWRWQHILAKTKVIPFARLFPILMTGFAANNLLPARVGEFVRAYLLGREEGINPSLALATIVVERVCDGLTLIALMAMTLLLFPIPVADPKLQVVELAATLIFGVATVALVALLFFPRPILSLVRLCLRPVPEKFATKITGLLDAFIEGLEALRSPIALARIAGLSLVVWICEGGTFAFVLLAFPIGLGREEWIAATVFLLVFVNLGIMIPSAPGYVGTYQLFAKLALGAFGIAASAAVALSFVAHALQYTLITSVGLLSLWKLGFSPRNLGQMARAEQTAAATHATTLPEAAD